MPVGHTLKPRMPEQVRLIGDLKEAGQQVIVAAGGGRGKGNAHFVSSRQIEVRALPNPAKPGGDKELEIEPPDCWPTSVSSVCPMPENQP